MLPTTAAAAAAFIDAFVLHVGQSVQPAHSATSASPGADRQGRTGRGGEWRGNWLHCRSENKEEQEKHAHESVQMKIVKNIYTNEI